jgi:putative endonuclease
MTRAHELGRAAETWAARALEAGGWCILARNYRFGHSEIDLIARRGRTVAFVEVKARSGREFGHPLEAIGWAKRKEIERVARSWIARHGTASDCYRFDAVAVTRQPDGTPAVEHIEDAWRPAG